MEFRPRPFPFRLFLGAVFGLPLLLLVMVVLETGSSPADLARALQQEFAADTTRLIESLLMLLAAVAGIGFTLLFQRRARIRVDSGHIAFCSGLPGIFRYLVPDWQFDYAAIESAALQPVGRGNFLTLVITPQQGRKRQLLPQQWIEPGSRGRSGSWFRMTRVKREDAQRLLRETPLLRQLQAAGVTIDMNLEQHYRPGLDTSAHFDLTTNRTALACLLLMVGLGLYALVDGVLLTGDRYAATPPYLWFALAALLVAALAAARLQRAAVPRLESTVLALLLGVSVALAVWPGLLRINAVTAADGPEQHVYTLAADGVLQPDTAGLPVMRRPIDANFWNAQSAGSRWPFAMRRGLFGFWQYDSRPLIENIRQYYARL
ncbi:hypothetical protein J2T55_001491 [Methylohalomonas lacus]|uniref:Uncharacterized protein n=1 Tax=Methylohalomonas lacus TaxID=398773 RepID=A0AAE3HKI1_9GAMM|nr:hypothetical protein [Methylohalomonas lacus]MCS3903470.1 hypothetical protein [Methylohalomonas lacus]